jgi:hypothetical protein
MLSSAVTIMVRDYHNENFFVTASPIIGERFATRLEWVDRVVVEKTSMDSLRPGPNAVFPLSNAVFGLAGLTCW